MNIRNTLKLAAIDIGSNAIRFQVSYVNKFEGNFTFKKLEYIRFPLRLGHDVFSIGRISQATESKFVKLLGAFRSLLELYEVDDFMICATSAMREASNGFEVADRIKNELSLDINIIDGSREAEMINKSLKLFLQDGNYIHIDVGGGSTELNIYEKKEKIAARSFQLGSVRSLKDTSSPIQIKRKMRTWIMANLPSNEEEIVAIGTGGNINKIFDIAYKRPGKALSIKKVNEIKEHIESMSVQERIFKLQLNPDRADVIVPAADIYIAAMQFADAKKIIVPDVGLKDGILEMLFEKNKERFEA
ncbi:phosphatase [Fulvivirgaceae bacterium BMA10]|uniref:Phosphatase n=1 Tax=Splendidivirga corallicola TaxID=3051826 RepID=A0ABT8KR50_9BACT|nr:phosphatase [Fulvivirgaceae bacterium BMA10]